MAKKAIHQAVRVQTQTGKADFLGLRLIESAAKLGQLRNDELPGRATQAINAAVGIRADHKSAAVTIRIQMNIAYDDDLAKEPAVKILAGYVINFSISGAFASKEACENFLQQVGMQVIWPYWREYVQSMTTRMGLPAFPVPQVNTTPLALNREAKPA